MSETEHNPVMNEPRRVGRWIRRGPLVGGAVLWLFFGPFGLVSYAGGLFNSTATWMLLASLMIWLVPVAFIALAVSITQAVRTWHGLSPPGRRRSVFMVVVWGGLIVPTVLGFAGFRSSPFDMYVRGFTRYVHKEADVEAIRSWLNALDPSDYTDNDGTIIEKLFTRAELPPCVAHLRPKWATIRPDDAWRLTVQVLWGGGMIGHWGIVVGPKDMPMPPSDPHDLQLPLAPGSYIWSGD